MPRLRTSGGPLSQPTHTGANQTSPARRARSPIRLAGWLNEVTRPAPTSPSPAPTVSVAGRPEPPAEVVNLPRPWATARAPKPTASATGPAASRARFIRWVKTAVTARLWHAVGGAESVLATVQDWGRPRCARG